MKAEPVAGLGRATQDHAVTEPAPLAPAVDREEGDVNEATRVPDETLSTRSLSEIYSLPLDSNASFVQVFPIDPVSSTVVLGPPPAHPLMMTAITAVMNSRMACLIDMLPNPRWDSHGAEKCLEENAGMQTMRMRIVENYKFPSRCVCRGQQSMGRHQE